MKQNEEDEKPTRAFYWLSQSWYSDADYKDSITIGLYFRKDGGTSGEFCMKWYDLGGNLCPQVQMFSDAWQLLRNFEDLLEWLMKNHGTYPTPEKFAAALRLLGIEDWTERKRKF